MAELCRQCGSPLPNAAGDGLYCPHCGEPVSEERVRDAYAQAEALLLIARRQINNAANIYKRLARVKSDGEGKAWVEVGEAGDHLRHCQTARSEIDAVIGHE